MADIIRPDVFEERARRLLRKGDGGGHDGGMPPNIDSRGEALETDVKEMKSDLKTLIEDVARLDGKLSNLPTTFQLISWFVGVSLGLVALVFTVARAMK